MAGSCVPAKNDCPTCDKGADRRSGCREETNRAHNTYYEYIDKLWNLEAGKISGQANLLNKKATSMTLAI